MRDIKFRAWDKKNKTMSSPFTLYEIAETDCDEDSIEWTTKLSDRGDFEVIQFAGVHDKNGKEIYEGDIIKSQTGNIGIVKFIEGGFCWSYDDRILGSATDRWAEVIGNIYENHELLNPK